MKKIIFIIIPSIILALIVFLTFQYFFNRVSAKGALQVTASPKSKVYVDNKLLGETPLCRCEEPDMLTTGEYTIRLVPNDTQFQPYEDKITVAKSVLTVVDRKFAKGAASEGSVIALSPLREKEAIELLVTTFPEKADVFLDNNPIGVTPLLLKKNLTDSDHTLRIRKEGYKEKSIRIRTPKGYKLTSTIYLGIDDESATATTPTPSISPSGSITPTGGRTTPTPKSQGKVTILETPNGFLRVRSSPSLTAEEVTRVRTGQSFTLLEESAGWYQIELPTGETGWISGQFAEKE
jgi:hypothetical protein